MQGVFLVTRQSPAFAGRPYTEGYFTQPGIMAHANFRRVLTVRAMASLEGITLRRGELNPGAIGEGYIDRRHPHTYLHELTATLESSLGGVRGSVTAGKGFAPFGTDDPMTRPFVKYPINHHLAQVLERVVGIAAINAGALTLEVGAFNGDEPESPSDAPNRARLWDSWGTRATIGSAHGAELQLSHARVRSPEHAGGGGTDDRKWSASARYESPGRRYALAEWARTTEYSGSRPSFTFRSFLIEGETPIGKLSVAAQLEVTERPDEDRLTNPFRTPLAGHDFSILGRTRWTILGARVAAPVAVRNNARIVPFVEIGWHHVRETLRPSGFSPDRFYGSDRIWTASLGARMAFGRVHRRMGRYGAAIVSMAG